MRIKCLVHCAAAPGGTLPPSVVFEADDQPLVGDILPLIDRHTGRQLEVIYREWDVDGRLILRCAATMRQRWPG